MTTKEFIEKLAGDEALAKKMESCKSPEEAYEVAKEAGLTDDIESFKAIMTVLNKQLKGELSDEELDEVAGGISEDAGCAIFAAGLATYLAVGSTTFYFTGSVAAAAA